MIPAAVFGAAGRMGGLILREAPGHLDILQTFDRGDTMELASEVRVVLDFSLPGAWDHLNSLLRGSSARLVSGTTGLEPRHHRLLQGWSRERAVFYSSNMSVGIYVLEKLMKQANAMLGDPFDRQLIEFHHSRKVDSPSGTALTLLKNWPGSAGVHSIRGGDITGEHHLHYLGQGERLVLSHIATDRRVFALGAIRGAEFIVNEEPGLYGMEDMLG